MANPQIPPSIEFWANSTPLSTDSEIQQSIAQFVDADA